MKKFPKTVFVYVSGYTTDGESTPLLGVVADVDEFPEDYSMEKIGIYSLQQIKTLVVKKDLQ